MCRPSSCCMTPNFLTTWNSTAQISVSHAHVTKSLHAIVLQCSPSLQMFIPPVPRHRHRPGNTPRSLAYFARSLVFLARSASGLPLVCRFWSMKMAASAGHNEWRYPGPSKTQCWHGGKSSSLKIEMSFPLIIVHHSRSIVLLWRKYSTHPALTILLGFPKVEISIEATFRPTRCDQHATIATPKWHSFWKGNLQIRKHFSGPT